MNVVDTSEKGWGQKIIAGSKAVCAMNVVETTEKSRDCGVPDLFVVLLSVAHTELNLGLQLEQGLTVEL